MKILHAKKKKKVRLDCLQGGDMNQSPLNGTIIEYCSLPCK